MAGHHLQKSSKWLWAWSTIIKQSDQVGAFQQDMIPRLLVDSPSHRCWALLSAMDVPNSNW